MFARNTRDRPCAGSPCEKCALPGGALHVPVQAPWGILTHCPGVALSADLLELGERLADAELGVLPYAGGMQQQPARFIHAWRMLNRTGWIRYIQGRGAKRGGS